MAERVQQPDLFPEALDAAYAELAILAPYEPEPEYNREDDYERAEARERYWINEDFDVCDLDGDDAYARQVCQRRWGPL